MPLQSIFTRRLALVVAAAAAAVAVAISAAPRAATPAVAAALATGSAEGTAAPGVVYHGDALPPFLRAVQAGRVDIAGIGDGNQISGGNFGHDHGRRKAWSDRVGLYGSGLIPVDAYGGY